MIINDDVYYLHNWLFVAFCFLNPNYKIGDRLPMISQLIVVKEVQEKGS